MANTDTLLAVAAWERKVERRRGARDALVAQRDQLDEKIISLAEALSMREQALEVCKEVEEVWHKTFNEDLSSVVSQGLTLVFETPMRLEIESNFQRDASAVTFYLHEGKLKTQIIGEKGGGHVNVVSFLLRTLLLLNTRPALRKVLVLDEAFAEVSAEFVPNVAALLRKLCDETGVQIILVTHEPSFGEQADFVYEVTIDKGVSSVELITRGEASHLYED